MRRFIAIIITLIPICASPQLRVIQTRSGGRPPMTFVQGTSCDAGAGGSSAVCTWPAALTAGDLIIGACGIDTASVVLTVSDANGNYTSEGSVGSATAPGKLEVFSAITVGGPTTTTCSLASGSTGVVMILGEFRNPANPLAGDTPATQLQTTTTTPNPGSVTLTATSSIFVFAWQASVASFTAGNGTGYTLWTGTNITGGTHGASSVDGMMAQYILSVPAGSSATAFGTSTSETWNSIAVPIKN